MPPRGHSHSSHSSSSHHSSSHHSSSSRSSSSRSSSGVSRHSTSSYSSTYRGPSRSAGHSIPYRSRQNQPTGYQSGVHGSAPKQYHCKNHDYVYYHTSWFDDATGVFYKKGYYDENGKQYDDLLIRDAQTNEIKFVCEYCGTEVRTVWKEGVKPTCPNCSAQLDEVISDELLPPVVYHDDEPVSTGFPRKLILIIIAAVMSVNFLIPACFAMVSGLGAASSSYSYSSSGSASYDSSDFDSGYDSGSGFSDSIYVEELGRTCYWDSSADSYYDPDTDCYFWYNDELDPPLWQYWYEGISSDFGDYGWMEYVPSEGKWYIEADDSEWIPLPAEYPTDYLWYIHDNY